MTIALRPVRPPAAISSGGGQGRHQEHWQDDLADLVRAVLAEQAQHAEDLLDRVVGSLFHVGLSLDTAAGQPAELARERISQALQRLMRYTLSQP